MAAWKVWTDSPRSAPDTSETFRLLGGHDDYNVYELLTLIPLLSLSGLDELTRELDFRIFDAGRARNVTGQTVYVGLRLKRRPTHRCYPLALVRKTSSPEIFRKKATQWNNMTDIHNHVYECSELVLQ